MASRAFGRAADLDDAPGLIVRVRGVVQGVGFRPFVYRLAKEHRLEGSVSNTLEGVVIRLRGEASNLRAFVEELPEKRPPLARIGEISVESAVVPPMAGFRIDASEAGQGATTLIPPDVTVCDACLGELFDCRDRRYRYPFINCTDCGPRYTLIRGLPYDRALTTMASFTLCAQCRREYEDPENRRFHAEPNACPRCGPRVRLLDGDGSPTGRMNDPISETVRRIQSGAIVAVKGVGGFHLVVDATSEDTVARLRVRKQREEKPLALMVRSLERAREICRVDPEEAALLCGPERPIVLLERLTPSPIAQSVAPGHRRFGVMLAYTPLHALLLDSPLFAVVATSGNRSEEPITISNDEALDRLGDIADFFLVHDRPIHRRADDSIARCDPRGVRLLRRARGYAPRPITLPDEAPPLLAVGGELKNTICLTRGREAFLSPHIGDLDNLEAFESFKTSIRHLSETLEIEPVAVVHDLHPDYLSTRWAIEESGLPSIAVQHHHAHIAAVMAEHGVSEKVVGIALDGTGFGPDGTVWGGEILVADRVGFERKAHLPQVVLPGGDRAAREPWRMAVAWLHRLYGREFLGMKLPFLETVSRDRVRKLVDAIEANVGWPMTSSCGRLFDAVAALLCVRQNQSYEGQAAMELEAMAEGATSAVGWYEGDFSVDDVLRHMVEGKRDAASLAMEFHVGIAEWLALTAEQIAKESSIGRVALGGGCFQNCILLREVSKHLESAGLEVLVPSEVPANDGGLALGQAAVASARRSP
ncbi:MAG TPA: carbamoyltransferase HypF [Vicinamibacteria bacterium]|nr:carbamoyltransferase HypF [Vicinamibacteria bacterium]